MSGAPAAWRRRLRELLPAGSGRTRNARRRRGRRASHAVAAVVFAAIGLLVATTYSAHRAEGDAQAQRERDLPGLVSEQAERSRQLQARQSRLQGEVNALSNAAGDQQTQHAQQEAESLGGPAGLTPVSGQGITVVLDDAPRAARADGVDVDALVVHQQDIQAVVNAMWAGGAEGVAIQGQRLISTTAVRCVGNSVVVQGVPYPPPYRIEAVGDPTAMLQALARSPEVAIYQQYVDAYGLGYTVSRGSVKLPGFTGSVALSYAEVDDD